uniref:Peptidase S53 activation domain-containing protein n=1 Tax=Alexandrium monilatum TaxID=311494 RepID=A0A7S4PYM6_9DINO
MHPGLVAALLAGAAAAAHSSGGGGAAEAFRRNAAVQGWRDEGPVAEGEEVELDFWVKLTHKDALRQALEDVSNPDSPDYGHYLTKEEADALVAPAPEDIATVRRAIRGFDVKEQNKGAILSTTVPVGFANRLLGGKFMRFCRGAGEHRACVLRNPIAEVPSALRDACDVISPLDEPLPPAHPGPIIGRSQSLQLAGEVQGCCFSIGYGALMRPCCLSTQRAGDAGACKVGRRLGGATGYRAGACPQTAEQAADWLAAQEGAGSAASAVGVSTAESHAGDPGLAAGGIAVVGLVAACALASMASFWAWAARWTSEDAGRPFERLNSPRILPGHTIPQLGTAAE